MIQGRLDPRFRFLCAKFWPYHPNITAHHGVSMSETEITQIGKSNKYSTTNLKEKKSFATIIWNKAQNSGLLSFIKKINVQRIACLINRLHQCTEAQDRPQKFFG